MARTYSWGPGIDQRYRGRQREAVRVLRSLGRRRAAPSGGVEQRRTESPRKWKGRLDREWASEAHCVAGVTYQVSPSSSFPSRNCRHASWWVERPRQGNTESRGRGSRARSRRDRHWVIARSKQIGQWPMRNETLAPNASQPPVGLGELCPEFASNRFAASFGAGPAWKIWRSGGRVLEIRKDARAPVCSPGRLTPASHHGTRTRGCGKR